MLLGWLQKHDKTNNMTCVPSKDSDQTGRIIISLCCALYGIAEDPMFLHADSEDWSDSTDAQADQSLRWVQMSFCWFCHEAAHMQAVFWDESWNRSLTSEHAESLNVVRKTCTNSLNINPYSKGNLNVKVNYLIL